ncbi:MAG TPA: HAD-IA family hydrolase [Candidatus Acidoferrales bacterium]|jgi:phosphoglycolate phosphatase|nr:HAD-IA family hydrolase [Candidatus Acidoferrales bacterium]
MGGNNGEERGRFGEARVLIFDLDGTLIDSKLDLAISVNATLRHMDREPLADETIFSYVGNGAQLLVQRALGEGVTPEQIEKGLAFFLAYYRAHMLDNTVAYPGVREGLELLKDRELAVLTNKPVRFSHAILAGLGLSNYFRYIYGGNSFATKKPDPEGVNTLLRDFGATPREAIMVGDSEVDVRTARNSGTWACGVTYGLGLDGMRAHPPDVMLDSLAELPRHLDKIETPRRTA